MRSRSQAMILRTTSRNRSRSSSFHLRKPASSSSVRFFFSSAAGTPRNADLAAVKDEPVRGHRPAAFRDEGVQVLFDPDGVGLAGEAEAARDAGHVRVDHEALVLAECVAK